MLLPQKEFPKRFKPDSACKWIHFSNPFDMREVNDPQRKSVFKWNLALENSEDPVILRGTGWREHNEMVNAD